MYYFKNSKYKISFVLNCWKITLIYRIGDFLQNNKKKQYKTTFISQK